MLCKNCGNEMNNGATFCNRCGMNYGTISQNLSSSNSVNPNAATVTAKKKLSTKTIVAIVCSIIALSIASCLGVSLVIGFLVLSGDDSVIIENDNCQLGATYSFTPEEFIDKYNKTLDVIGDMPNDLYLPNINEWIKADLLNDGNICYSYVLSSDLTYWIYTYQNGNVNQVIFSMSDSYKVKSGVSIMAISESTATGVTDKEAIMQMYDIMANNLLQSPFNYKNSIVNFADDGIVLAPVSDDYLLTMDYYDISESDLW